MLAFTLFVLFSVEHFFSFVYFGDDQNVMQNRATRSTFGIVCQVDDDAQSASNGKPKHEPPKEFLSELIN